MLEYLSIDWPIKFPMLSRYFSVSSDYISVVPQVFSVLLWFFDDYVNYATVIHDNFLRFTITEYLLLP